MAHGHTQGCGGLAYLATAHLSCPTRAQQAKNWCNGFFFPLPACAGIRPTLFLFGFRADALNEHLYISFNFEFEIETMGPPQAGPPRGSEGILAGGPLTSAFSDLRRKPPRGLRTTPRRPRSPLVNHRIGGVTALAQGCAA